MKQVSRRAGTEHIATLKAGSTVVEVNRDGIIVAHPDEPVTLIKWDGTRETLKPITKEA